MGTLGTYSALSCIFIRELETEKSEYLTRRASLLTQDLSQTDSGLCRTQLRRQTDIWTLLSAAVSHRPASDLALVEQEVELNNLVIRENIQAREVGEEE